LELPESGPESLHRGLGFARLIRKVFLGLGEVVNHISDRLNNFCSFIFGTDYQIDIFTRHIALLFVRIAHWPNWPRSDIETFQGLCKLFAGILAEQCVDGLLHKQGLGRRC
jgi:hypothetical protein